MKIKLLFVNDSLALAGGEKSLIALLSKIDPDKYEIDLQLFRYNEPLEQFVPDYVNLLPPLPYTEFLKLSWTKSILTLNYRFLRARLRYSLDIRKGHYRNSEKAQYFWESSRNIIKESSKRYDVAIAYSQNTPTFYVAEHVNAAKKVAWVNVSVQYQSANKQFQERYYKKYNKIIHVSTDTKTHFLNEFPDFNSNQSVIEDIIDYKSMYQMSLLKNPSFDIDTFNILTVARLDKLQKGYDITLEVCRILKTKGVNFHWYAIGKGAYRAEMERYIAEHCLESHFSFLGTTGNPYPYFRAADLYVQTSRHEGYGLSIAEARLLNTPVVTTRFDAVFMQMIDGKNGLVTDINAEAVAAGIERMMNDKGLYQSVVENLKQEKKENTESIEKFDSMIRELLDAK